LADEPIVVDRAEGMYFWDTDGNRYLDGVSSLWVNVHGHRRAEIDAAIVAQLGKLDHTTFLGLTHEPGIGLRRTVATAPAASARLGGAAPRRGSRMKMASRRTRERVRSTCIGGRLPRRYPELSAWAASTCSTDLSFDHAGHVRSAPGVLAARPRNRASGVAEL
jgi:hypothetical protein